MCGSLWSRNQTQLDDDRAPHTHAAFNQGSNIFSHKSKAFHITYHYHTMASLVDERAPGVSPAMRRRIAAALAAGERPMLRGNNLRLGRIVLQRTDGRDTPALREVELQMGRRDLPVAGAFDTFQPGTTCRGRNTYAIDAAGHERVVARFVKGENRVTRYGRR